MTEGSESERQTIIEMHKDERTILKKRRTIRLDHAGRHKSKACLTIAYSCNDGLQLDVKVTVHILTEEARTESIKDV